MWGSTPIDDKHKGFQPMLVIMGDWFWEDDKQKPAQKPEQRPASKPNFDRRRKPRY